MVKMIHALTGTAMYVAEARQAEYLAAGHRLAEAPAPAPAVQTAEQTAEPEQPAPAVQAAAKTTRSAVNCTTAAKSKTTAKTTTAKKR